MSTKNLDEAMSTTMHCDTGIYIGDPCYVLNEDLYESLICNRNRDLLTAEDTICHSIKYGDGCYSLTVDKRLTGVVGVDSGLIGAVNLEACSKRNPSLYGHIILCSSDVDVKPKYDESTGMITISINNHFNDKFTIEVNTGAYLNI